MNHSNSFDPFRPRTEPALTLYKTFHREAALRDERPFDEWTTAEVDAVWNAARTYAEKHGLHAPSREQVETENTHASGHSDFASQWAHGVARLMRGRSS